MKRRTSNRLLVLRAERSAALGRKVTQEYIARQAGMKPTRYWRIENGYEPPTDTERARLARVLRVDEAALGFQMPVTEMGQAS